MLSPPPQTDPSPPHRPPQGKTSFSAGAATLHRAMSNASLGSAGSGGSGGSGSRHGGGSGFLGTGGVKWGGDHDCVMRRRASIDSISEALWTEALSWHCALQLAIAWSRVKSPPPADHGGLHFPCCDFASLKLQDADAAAAAAAAAAEEEEAEEAGPTGHQATGYVPPLSPDGTRLLWSPQPAAAAAAAAAAAGGGLDNAFQHRPVSPTASGSVVAASPGQQATRRISPSHTLFSPSHSGKHPMPPGTPVMPASPDEWGFWTPVRIRVSASSAFRRLRMNHLRLKSAS
jgi:hypothetical protein